MVVRTGRGSGFRVGLSALAFAAALSSSTAAFGAPAPPPMSEPQPAAAPAPPPMVDPNAPPPASPAVTPAPATAPAPMMRPPDGSGGIIGGSILAGVGGAVLFGSGIACAIVCGTVDDTRPILLGTMAGGAAALGGGVALEIFGFQRFDAALDWERRYQVPATARPQSIALGSMLGGFFTGSFFGLISGGITTRIYKNRWNEAHYPGGRVPVRLSWAPLVGSDTRGVVLGGRF